MKLRIALASLLLLVLAVSTWFAVRISRQNDRIALLEQQLRAAQSKSAQSSLAPAPAVPAPGPAETPAHEPHQTRRAPAESATCPEPGVPYAKLQEATAALTRVQARVVELESQMEELTRERTRMAAAETESQSRLSELQRNIDSLTAERGAMDRRIKDVESENARLRQQTQASTQKNTDFTKLVTEFQDISRRQQIYITNILRRYRELTDLLRSLPGMVEMKGNGPELSRIQSAISMADEDVRQLNDLNARLGRVQRQLTTAKP